MEEFKEKELLSKVIAMPTNTNPRGDIFGGWIMSLMDIAAGSLAGRVAKGATVTKAVKELTFDSPIFVGDEISVYASVQKIGKTSVTLEVEVCIRHEAEEEIIPAVRGTFIMVAIDKNRRPRAINNMCSARFCNDVVNGFCAPTYS